MSLTTLAEILSFLELSADDSYGSVASVKAGVEAQVKAYCRRNIESTSYKDVYSNSNNYIVLKDFPVTVVSKVAKGKTSVMYITNTNQFTNATVSVTSTRVNLVYNGTTYSGDLTFATNTNLSILAAAVNGAGNGWKAVIQNEDFNSILSTELLPLFGVDALYNKNVQLCIPNTGDSFDLFVDDVRGIIRNDSYIAGEFENIYINYTAGYTIIPDAIVAAVKFWVKDLYTRQQETSLGLLNYSVAGLSKIYEEIPASVKLLLNAYKRILI